MSWLAVQPYIKLGGWELGGLKWVTKDPECQGKRGNNVGPRPTSPHITAPLTTSLQGWSLRGGLEFWMNCVWSPETGREERRGEKVHEWRYRSISIATQFWCHGNDLINPAISLLPKCNGSIFPASGPALPPIPIPLLSIQPPLVRALGLPLGTILPQLSAYLTQGVGVGEAGTSPVGGWIWGPGLANQLSVSVATMTSSHVGMWPELDQWHSVLGHLLEWGRENSLPSGFLAGRMEVPGI